MNTSKFYDFLNHIFKNNNKEELKETFLNNNNNFDMFEFSFYEENNLILLENKDFILSIKKDNTGQITISFVDPLLWENGIVKLLENIDIEFEDSEMFFNYIKSKNNPYFYYKRHLLGTIEEHGIVQDFDFVDFKDKLTLSIEDVICLMKDSYLKGLKNKKS